MSIGAISYEWYKVLHILAVLALFLALGGSAAAKINDSGGPRKLLGITHGLALIVIAAAGFGLLARLGMSHSQPWPIWVYLKVVIWLLLAASIVPLRKSKGLAGLFWLLLPALGAAAAFLAIFKAPA